MVIDHIGVVVRSLNDGMRQWENLFGYRKNSDIVLNTRQKVRVVFMVKKDSLTVKLIEPSETNSPVFTFAKKGGGLHHLAFRCSDMMAQIASMRESKSLLVVPPEPGEAFMNNPIAFLLAKNNLRIELIDTAEKQGWINDPPSSMALY